MPERRINVDTLSYQVDNPVTGQPPVPRTAYRGQVVDLPDAVIEHLKGETTRAFYDPLPGSSQRRVRDEPVLLDPNPSAGDVESHAAAMSKIAEMEQEIARLRATAPPVSTPLPDISGTPVVLGSAVTGTVPIEDPDASGGEEESTSVTLSSGGDGAEGSSGEGSSGEGSGGGESTTGSADLAGMSVQELTKVLTDQPDLAAAVETAEMKRLEPRPRVLQAVARARAAGS